MTTENETLSWRFCLLVALALGAALGLADALAGLARLAGLPRSPLAAGAGFFLMAMALAVYKKKRVVPCVAAGGVLAKWLAVPLLGLPLLCQANAHLAMLLNGAFLFAGVAMARRRITGNPGVQAAVAGGAAFGAGAAFFALGRFWAPCAHLLSFRYAGGAGHYLFTRVAPAALAAALLFPLGYALGRRLERWLLPRWLARKPLFAPLAAAWSLGCWALIAWITAAGR
ncbi:MAG TPA: hypothetical protein PK919_12460 [Candidatus Aminicenantes bacterium]|nr:hypothetical protein [Candidatus Aminicenantes bacterium]